MNLECWKEIYLDEQLVQRFKKDGSIHVSAVADGNTLVMNQGIIINRALLGIFDPATQRIRRLKTDGVSGMKPGDIKDLQLLYDVMWNPNIKVIVVDAIAGSGKTSTTMAFASHLALNPRTAIFERLILTRPNSEVGKGHGFLPGDIDEKLAPLQRPFFQWIERFGQYHIDELKQEEKLISQPLAFVRGLDIRDAFLVIDEAQNMTRHEMKTMLTRVAENTKVIIIGDSSPNQIDMGSLNSENNGLAHIKSRFYGQFDWFAYVELKECLRGDVCAAATKLL